MTAAAIIARTEQRGPPSASTADRKPFQRREVIATKVAIIGAGPGGTAAAAHLGQLGVRDVVLVDRHDFPRDKTCGSGISPRGIGTLRELGVWHHVEPHATWIDSVRLVTASGRESTQSAGVEAIICKRRVFDQILLDAALARGVRFLPHFTAESLLEDRGRVRGFRARDGRTVYADHVLIAGGCHCRVGVGPGDPRSAGPLRPGDPRSAGPLRPGDPRSAGPLRPGDPRSAGPLRPGDPRSAGPLGPGDTRSAGPLGPGPERKTIKTIMGWWEDVDFDRGRIELIFDEMISPYYGWLFPEDERRVNIGITFRDEGTGERRNARELFSRFLDKHYADRLGSARQVGGLKGHPVAFAYRFPKLVSPGALVVGEAGNMTHPATAEGIYPAMRSGMLAAEAVADAISGRRDERAAYLAYQAACRRTFLPSFWAGRAFLAIAGSKALDWLVALGDTPLVKHAASKLLASI